MILLPTIIYVHCTGYCYQLLYMQHSHQQLYITGYGYQQSFPEEEVQYNA